MEREFGGEHDEEEETEKYILALSIMNFLKFISEEEQTKKLLMKHHGRIKQILLYE